MPIPNLHEESGDSKSEEDQEGKPDFKLLPEFGNWMIEAVPTEPYGAYSDPEQLLACAGKIKNRRQYLQKFLAKRRKTSILSTSASPILGVDNCMTSTVAETKSKIEEDYANGLLASNPLTHQLFIPERTASPHPRFLGLAKSIYERRGKKVNIQVPRFLDTKTMTEPTQREPVPG